MGSTFAAACTAPPDEAPTDANVAADAGRDGGATDRDATSTSDTGDAGDGGIVSPRGTGQTAALEVGADGGTLRLESLSLEVPEGALDTDITLRAPSSAAV